LEAIRRLGGILGRGVRRSQEVGEATHTEFFQYLKLFLPHPSHHKKRCRCRGDVGVERSLLYFVPLS
jgi:hypothetical protein